VAGLLSVTTRQPVTRRLARSQPTARATETGSVAAPLRAAILWPRPWALIEIDRYDRCVVRQGRGI
jgi:hypothetical protein